MNNYIIRKIKNKQLWKITDRNNGKIITYGTSEPDKFINKFINNTHILNFFIDLS